MDGLANNASMLLALFIVYELSCLISRRLRLLRQILSGLLISGICIAIMAMPFELSPGVVFDTRSILISITGLLFGVIPTAITAILAIVFRISLGGDGMLMGIAVITVSALIGLAWRRWLYPKQKKWRFLNFLLMGIFVHAAMLACVNLIPYPQNLLIWREISLPVMLIYPVTSVLLSMLLLHQQERRTYQKQLQLSEEKYRRIAENSSDIIWTSDANLHTTYVSPSVEKILGESAESHMQRTLQEKFPPRSLDIIGALLPEELKLEADALSTKDRTRTVELEHYRADGSLVWLSMNISILRDQGGKLTGFLGISRDITAQKLAEISLEKERDLSRTYLDIVHVMIIALDKDAHVTLVNKEGCSILGCKKEDVIGKAWIDHFVPESYRPELKNMFGLIIAGNLTAHEIYENTVLTSSGEERIISWRNTLLYDENDQVSGILSSGIDITEQRQALNNLRESERIKRVLLSNLAGMAYRCNYDPDWTMQFVSDGCFALTGYHPESLLHNKALSFNKVIAQEYRERLWNEWALAIAQKLPFRSEYEIITADNNRKWVLELGQGIYTKDGEVEALEGIIVDITEQKQREAQILYMTDHDLLTGLFNRKYYEEAKARLDEDDQLPLSVIIADINGLRIINDAFGYEQGDRMVIETAKLIQGVCRESDVPARTGGGEFSLLLPKTDAKQALIMIQALKSAFENSRTLFGGKPGLLNVSLGFGTKNNPAEPIKAAEREAEAYMNKNKLLERTSQQNNILSSVMATMYARSHETEAHAMRLAVLCRKVGQRLGLPQKSLDDLELLSMLHDIGKVGIEDRILNKNASLTSNEWAEMRKHPQIGYRITKATTEFASVSEHILSHHERWDGKGYPQGLKGTQIPLLSRILAVADAYDAMTQKRVYKKTITKEMAIEELKQNAGTQFDTDIVSLFIDIVTKEQTQ